MFIRSDVSLWRLWFGLLEVVRAFMSSLSAMPDKEGD